MHPCDDEANICRQWDMIIAQANQDPSNLSDGETIKVVGNIMKTNVAACSSIGSYFYPQIGRIYHDMLSMYRATSQMISDSVAREGRLDLAARLATFPVDCS